MLVARIVSAVIALSFVALGSTLLPAPAGAGSGLLHVDVTGDCNGETPCYETIQEAVNNATPLTEILVFPGTYAESVNLSSMGTASVASGGELGGVLGRIGLFAVDESGEPGVGTATIDPGAIGGPGAGRAIFNEGVFTGQIEIGGFNVTSPDTDAIFLTTDDQTIDIFDVTAEDFGDADGANDGQDVRGGDDGFDLTTTTAGVGISRSRALGSNNPGGDGFDINTNTGDVQIVESGAADNIGGNFSEGFDIMTIEGGHIAIIDSSASGNGSDGFNLRTTFFEGLSGGITIDGSSATNNAFHGFDGDTGDVDGEGGSVLVNDSTANGNGANGFFFDDVDGDLMIADSIARDNGDDGVELDEILGVATIVNSMSSGNAEDGFSLGENMRGDVEITDSMTTENAEHGVLIVTDDADEGVEDVTIMRTTSSDNGFNGFDITADGNVTVDGVTAARNGSEGPTADGIEVRGHSDPAAVGPATGGASGVVSILNSWFIDNVDTGIVLEDLLGSDAHEVRESAICGNTNAGLRLAANVDLNAMGNWWGDGFGPQHPTNPGTSGNAVIDGANGGAGDVDFSHPIDTAVAEVLDVPAGDGLPAGTSHALRIRFFASSDESVTLVDGPGDPNGDAPFELTTDDGTLTFGEDEGDTVGAFVQEGFLNFEFTADAPGVSTIDQNGPCGLDGQIQLEIAEGTTHGDVDCDGGDVDALDALKVLQHVADLPVDQNEPCAAIGEPGGQGVFGDVDCDGDVDALDALKILQHVAALPVDLPDGCGPIGG